MNNLDAEIIVVGGGIAGAMAAYNLSQTYDTFLIEEHNLAAEASGIAAGMVNPFMSQRAAPMWRLEDVIFALTDIISTTHSSANVIQRNILRLTQSQEQIHYFKRADLNYPQYCQWIEGKDIEAQFPYLNAPFGGLWTNCGFSLDVKPFVENVVRHAQNEHKLEVLFTGLDSWKEHTDGVRVTLKTGKTLHAKKIILCLGWGYKRHPDLSDLNLHGVKGQIVTIANPLPEESWPLISAKGYVVSLGDKLVLGSNYDHHFTDLSPERHVTQSILENIGLNVPVISSGVIQEEKAAVRVDVPQKRMPMIGPIEKNSKVWVFTGFGSKGLLLAPMLSRELPQYLSNPDTIPKEVQISYLRQ